MPATTGVLDAMHRSLFMALSRASVSVHGALLRLCFESKHARPDPWGHAVEPLELDKYAQTLARIPPGLYRSIADVGCSEGTFTCLAAQVHPEADVVGMDISARAVARARRRAASRGLAVDFRSVDILNDDQGATFQLVFCSEVLYYLGRTERLDRACGALVELLAPDGFLVMAHPWPECRRLYRPFDAHPRLVAVDERVFPVVQRPYAVNVYGHRPAV